MLWDISFNCQPFVNWTLARCHVVSFWRSRSWYFESLKVVVILKENTMMKLRKLDEKQTNKQKGSEFPKRNFRLLVCNFFISLIAAHLQTSLCYVDVKTLTSICIASFQSKSNVEEDVVRLVTSVKKKKKNSGSPWGIEPQTTGFRAPMLEDGLRRYEARFLVRTRKFFFVPRSWEDEKHLSQFRHRAQNLPSLFFY